MVSVCNQKTQRKESITTDTSVYFTYFNDVNNIITKMNNSSTSIILTTTSKRQFLCSRHN